MEKAAAAAAAERWRAWCSTKHRHQKLPVSLGDALDPRAQGMSPSDGMSTGFPSDQLGSHCGNPGL